MTTCLFQQLYIRRQYLFYGCVWKCVVKKRSSCMYLDTPLAAKVKIHERRTVVAIWLSYIHNDKRHIQSLVSCYVHGLLHWKYDCVDRSWLESRGANTLPLQSWPFERWHKQQHKPQRNFIFLNRRMTTMNVFFSCDVRSLEVLIWYDFKSYTNCLTCRLISTVFCSALWNIAHVQPFGAPCRQFAASTASCQCHW